MYEMLIKGSMVAIMAVGAVMIIAPKTVGKKSLTETKKGVMTVRIVGAVFAILGLLGFLLLGTISF